MSIKNVVEKRILMEPWICCYFFDNCHGFGTACGMNLHQFFPTICHFICEGLSETHASHFLHPSQMSLSVAKTSICTCCSETHPSWQVSAYIYIYIKGMSEELCRTFMALGVGTFFKSRNTLRQLLEESGKERREMWYGIPDFWNVKRKERHVRAHTVENS